MNSCWCGQSAKDARLYSDLPGLKSGNFWYSGFSEKWTLISASVGTPPRCCWHTWLSVVVCFLADRHHYFLFRSWKPGLWIFGVKWFALLHSLPLMWKGSVSVVLPHSCAHRFPLPPSGCPSGVFRRNLTNTLAPGATASILKWPPAFWRSRETCGMSHPRQIGRSLCLPKMAAGTYRWACRRNSRHWFCTPHAAAPGSAAVCFPYLACQTARRSETDFNLHLHSASVFRLKNVLFFIMSPSLSISFWSKRAPSFVSGRRTLERNCFMALRFNLSIRAMKRVCVYQC